MSIKPIEPCWDPANVRKAISSAGVALLSADDRPYFLATHAPVTRIWDERAQRRIGEAQCFAEVVTGRGDVMAAVHGNPGTGKSHLIHWLKLRTDDALSRGELKGICTILIQRSTGTLKDALSQMIQQLGSAFHKHLEPVRQALEKIGDHTAKEKLLMALSLELGSLRQNRDKPALPRSLKSLSEACRSEGFGRWLCRIGGPLDLNIRRLNEPAGMDGATEMAEFSAVDLSPTPEYRDPRHSSEAVRDLLDELDDDRELRLEAAAEMNDALRYAIQEVTGLGGNKLREVFDEIRRELKAQGQILAIFIEDVSAMGELDTEVINAVEPQPRPELCNMIAVLGLTEAGFARLRDNVRQRLTHTYSIGTAAAGDWREDPDETAKLAARYLNAIRLDEASVRRIAEHRRTVSDITESKCTLCPQVELCHQVFGSVTLGGVEVGMFPLTKAAPSRLLNALATDRPGIQRTPRGLLAQTMIPILSDRGNAVDLASVPPATLPVNVPTFDYWTAFAQTYCSGAGWTDEERQRLRIATGLWFDLPSNAQAEDLASALQPILIHFGFPKLSRNVKPAEARPKPVTPTPQPVTPQPVTSPASRKLNEFLQRLNRWKAGEKFQKDEEPRRLLAGLIRRAIAWDEEQVPTHVWKSLIQDKYEYVQIEGQTSNPVTSFLLSFPRNDETYHALEALAQFEHVGNGSWKFKYGGIYQRYVSRWLRRNHAMIVERLKAVNDVDASKPVAAAVRFLAAVAMFRSRLRLPDKRDDLVREVLANIWDDAGKPLSLSPAIGKLIEDMQSRCNTVRSFLFDELNVPQGATGGINFIDPRPILEHAEAFASDLMIKPLPEVYFSSYWKSRYVAMQRMAAYATLATAIASERQCLNDLLAQIKSTIESSGVILCDAQESMTAYCKALNEVMIAKKESRQSARPDPTFDPLWQRRIYAENSDSWGRAIRRGLEVIASTKNLDVLLFDPKQVKEATISLQSADRFLRDFKGELDELEASLFPDQADAGLEAEVLKLLSELSGVAGPSSSQQADESTSESEIRDRALESEEGTDANDVQSGRTSTADRVSPRKEQAGEAD
ncbi:MAG: hypothetical protein SGJ20_04365 [Planctomycetota bacterium]|nr:hypothetical protein [Planctomycetota bacterium]